MRNLDGQKRHAIRRLLAKAPRGEHASSVGRIAPGNIDVMHRHAVRNRDGSYSTVRSISIGPSNRQTLIPTVVGSRVVSDREAARQFAYSGQHLGKYSSIPAADRAAKQLHRQQARLFRNKYGMTGRG